MQWAKYIITTLMLITVSAAQSQTLKDSVSIYPNPFCKETKITLDIVNDGKVNMVVYNRWGQTVQAFFIDSLMSTGSYSFNFSGDTLIDGTYFFMFQNGSDKVNAIRLVKDCIASVKDTSIIKDNTIIYPNPSKSIVTIQLEGSKTVVISNLLGQNVKTIKTGLKEISLSGLASGTYILSVFNQDNKLLLTKQILYEK